MLEISLSIAAVAAVCLVSLSQYLIRRDRARLSALRDRLLDSGALRCVTTRRGVRLLVRWTVPPGGATRRHPVAIPNGLAATMFTIGRLHDALVSEGFAVLSYDRDGVGLSYIGASAPGVPETADDLMDAMLAVKGVFESDDGWLLLGPSMGSIAAQSFMFRYPSVCVGFVNMDGLAHPFHLMRTRFMRAAGVYRVVPYVAHIGLLRPLLLCARGFFARFQTSTFDVDSISAQMNLPEFWSSTGREMRLMMDMALDASKGWGPLAVEILPQSDIDALANTRPAQNGMFVDGAWRALPRSTCEVGGDWDDSRHVTDRLRALRSESPLGILFGRCAVRVIAARQYNYIGGNTFYNPSMKTWAAAEQTLHAAMARDGRRYVLPRVGHDSVFLETGCIVGAVKEVDAAAV